MKHEDIIEVTITLEVVKVSNVNREASKVCAGCVAEFDAKLCANLPRCESNEGSFIFKASSK